MIVHPKLQYSQQYRSKAAESGKAAGFRLTTRVWKSEYICGKWLWIMEMVQVTIWLAPWWNGKFQCLSSSERRTDRPMMMENNKLSFQRCEATCDVGDLSSTRVNSLQLSTSELYIRYLDYHFKYHGSNSATGEILQYKIVIGEIFASSRQNDKVHLQKKPLILIEKKEERRRKAYYSLSFLIPSINCDSGRSVNLWLVAH